MLIVLTYFLTTADREAMGCTVRKHNSRAESYGGIDYEGYTLRNCKEKGKWKRI